MRLLIIASAVLFGIGAATLGMSAESPDRERAETFRQLELFGDVLSRVESDYVVETDKAALIEAAINGMLTSLDPHSRYLPPEAFQEMQSTTRGEYHGIGIEVTWRDEMVTIVSPIAGTPGEAAGLEANDVILAVDGENMVGAGMDAVVERIRGPAGEPVTLMIGRDGMEPFEVTVVRAAVEVRSVIYRMDEDLPYLRITTFNENTTERTVAALRDLANAEGGSLPGLILDLRSNPGGLLEQSVSVASLFLDRGEVVSTRGRDPRDTRRYNAEAGDMLAGAPIVVLVNAGSASASEIVAGALQDRLRATVVGLPSFGKGSMQTVAPLRGGRDGALRLTTARYYTPAGRSIQGWGVIPDVLAAPRQITPETRILSGESDLRNALSNENGEREAPFEFEDIRQPPEDWDSAEDFQLHIAREELRARMARREARL
ncbi:MAG: S41 family peptidase [Oceanicaulis sp.]|nr:S41 family peptidase [Oceanicaulis sp.]